MILFSKRRNSRRQNRKYTRGRNKRKRVRNMKGGGRWTAADIALINYLTRTPAQDWKVEAIRTHVDNGASIAATIEIYGDPLPLYKYMAILNMGTPEHYAIYNYITTLPGYEPTYY